jgi:hypothetical protein
LVLSSIQPDVARRKEGRSKPDRVLRQAPGKRDDGTLPVTTVKRSILGRCTVSNGKLRLRRSRNKQIACERRRGCIQTRPWIMTYAMAPSVWYSRTCCPACLRSVMSQASGKRLQLGVAYIRVTDTRLQGRELLLEPRHHICVCRLGNHVIHLMRVFA